MTKKLFILAPAVIGLALASCSSEVEMPGTTDGTVTFTAKLPATINSRTYSDGAGATQLSYAVYEAGTTSVVYTSEEPNDPAAMYNGDNAFTLSLPLVKGHAYDFVFWADNADSDAYTFDVENQQVTVNYDNVVSNDETRDAFFTAEKGLLVNGAIQKTIELYRPFAQLNIGANDIAAIEKMYELGKTQVTVKEVYSTLNLLSGVASDPTEVTYAYAEVPKDESFPVAGYEYLSMNYILTGSQVLGEEVNSAQKETREISFTVQDADGKEITTIDLSAVPFRRNYRTNIYGSLFTEQADLTIDLVADYNNPDYDKEYPFSIEGDIRDYFVSVLRGEDTEMPDLDGFKLDDPATAQASIWNIWKEAYAKAGQTEMPNVNDIYDDWYAYNYYAAWTWALSNQESMGFYLGYMGSQPSEGWPLILSLHGSGNDANDEWEGTIAWDAYVSASQYENALYCIPKSPKGGTGCRWYQPSRQQAWEKLLRMAYASGKVDPNKIYFKGISEGAYGTQRLAAFYADYLAGAAPICGGEPLASAPVENFANIYYVARTGANDTSYGRKACTERVDQELAKLESAHPGYYKHYVELEAGADHSSTSYYGITDKVAEATRNACPKYFYWENFALGNVNGESYACRKSFYNIRPLEAQNGETDGNVHDAYEMNIDGNDIALNVYSVTSNPSEFVEGDGWSMNIGVEKTSVAATSGKVRIYLNDKLVDLSQPVTVTVNGTTAYTGTVAVSAEAMVESAALFFDPERVFTAYIDVEI